MTTEKLKSEQEKNAEATAAQAAPEAMAAPIQPECEEVDDCSCCSAGTTRKKKFAIAGIIAIIGAVVFLIFKAKRRKSK